MQPREEQDKPLGKNELLTPAYAALRRLLECPALNLDDESMEPEDRAAIDEAAGALSNFPAEYDDAYSQGNPGPHGD